MRNQAVRLALAVLLASCNRGEDPALAYSGIIPRPVSAVAGSGTFTLKSAKPLFQSPIGGDTAGSGIAFVLTGDSSLGTEGYELTVTEQGVRIGAASPAGLFYGAQTLRQLLPPGAEPLRGDGSWPVATGTVRDQPRFAWRGASLDVARHFFSVAEVKRFIDQLAAYKMNLLQLHLTDDQGWRIEIGAWPRLAEVGGLTEVGGGEGGFYTGAQYREIVAYAEERFITVIPEIDLPGHVNAALVAYPELNCNGKVPVPYTGIEVGFSSLCIRKPVAMQFVRDVIGELAAMTPGGYIHIGGDEAYATLPREYAAFIDSVQSIVRAQGKAMIGWEEIAQAALDPGSVVQHWRSGDLAMRGAAQGARILMSPSTRVYLDMKYDPATRLGQNWANYIEVDTAYMWDPAAWLPTLDEAQVTGVVAPLWTETVSTWDEAEFLLFPRLPAIAEVAWSPAPDREWGEFRRRLGRHGARMKAMGIDFYRSPRVPWADAPSTIQSASSVP
jgi:hexosaminidase